MNKLIFETLIAEASFRVAERTIKGVALDEAIREVSAEMELEETEVSELQTRAKKAPTPKPVVEDDEIDMDELVSDMGDEETPEVSGDAIHFNSPDELETAVGVLMYKGIPWVNKTQDSIQFADATDVGKAHDALKRRWDFVNQDERTVAVLEFDNLEDYQKVLDFIASKKMTVLKGTNDELVDDMDQALAEAEAAHKKAKKDAKEQGIEAPEAPLQSISYKALHKDKLTDVSSLDALYDNTARCLRIVKRWK